MGDNDDDNGVRFAYHPNSRDDREKSRRRAFRRDGTRRQGRGGLTGEDNVMEKRQKRKELSHDSGDATMAKRFRGENFRRGGSETEVERTRVFDGEMGAGREVRGERDNERGNRGGPFRQRYNDRQRDGQRSCQRGGYVDQDADRSRREDYQTHENTRYSIKP